MERAKQHTQSEALWILPQTLWPIVAFYTNRNRLGITTAHGNIQTTRARPTHSRLIKELKESITAAKKLNLELNYQYKPNNPEDMLYILHDDDNLHTIR